ncbi:hypothetical protein COOONC_02739 [Cooperia oncophora]
MIFNDFQFNPDRYFNGNKLEQRVVAFGLGKRSCLGESLAQAELYLVIPLFSYSMKNSLFTKKRSSEIKKRSVRLHPNFMIRDTNKQKRLEFCNKMLDSNEDFSQCVFTDETTIQWFGVLVQDNAPSHKSAFTTELLRMWKVRTLDWPPESPDLNPIEKRNIRTVDELRNAALAFWKTLTPSICEKYRPCQYLMATGTHAIVYFSSSRTDIVDVSSILGSFVINHTAKIRWGRKIYKGKVGIIYGCCETLNQITNFFEVLYVSSKDECEERINDVTEDGTLVGSFFSVGESTVSMPPTTSHGDVAHPVLREVKNVQSCLSEILEQTMHMKRTTGASIRQLELRMQASFSHLERKMNSVEESLEELKRKRKADSDEDELYTDDAYEQRLNVEQRKCSAKKVEFIREVIFKYFNVSHRSRKSVWQDVKNALNGRVRTARHRTMTHIHHLSPDRLTLRTPSYTDDQQENVYENVFET